MNLRDILSVLTPGERVELDSILATSHILWAPDVDNKPQCAAYSSQADITGFGGAAGGGKSDLALGLALTEHRKCIIFRKTATELPGIIDRLEELFGSRDGYNGQQKVWKFTRHDGVPVQIELGSFHNPGEEKGYQGRPHDLLVFDEASNMRERAVRFLLGWLRSVTPGQRKRALLTFNPPTDAEGRWIVRFFAPWLDKRHPNPAQPGELRWFVVVDDKDIEVADNRSCVVVEDKNGEKQLLYDFDSRHFSPDQIITPLSRTFIPSRVVDNKYLRNTGYMAHLQGLPEPLRSQMLYGDFDAGVEDDAFQVIPTKWVEAAMDRWRRPAALLPMDSVGVDVAMKGGDDTEIARRHGQWFDQPISYEGHVCIDGPTIAGFVLSAVRDRAAIHIDVFGVGAQPFGHLMQLNQHVLGVNMGELTDEVDNTGRLRFKNVRSLIWWRMREALDPSARAPIALPPDRRLLAELCTPTWKPVGGAIQVQSREDIIKKLGRSPDRATAYVLALMNTPKLTPHGTLTGSPQTKNAADYDPVAKPAERQKSRAESYDPTLQRRPR